MQMTDKTQLRKELKKQRREISPNERARRDRLIFERLIGLPQIQTSDMIFCYVSTPEEVDTRAFIEYCLKKGKSVFVPECVGDNMEFCGITSLDELHRGAFGIDEPCGNAYGGKTERAVCIVPGLRFDGEKYRLGYGKGYYDRFLSGFRGISVGLCYEELTGAFPRSEFDLPTDILITEETER